MDLQLNGKHALVTGSTSGIGQAIAARLLREGATVTINGRSQDSVEATVTKLRELGDVHGVAADVGTARGVLDLAAAAEKTAKVDILINNAGKFEPVEFEKITDEQWEDIYRVNVLSGIRLSRALLPAMKRAGWGRIVFIASESALSIPTEMIHYGMTKTAQLSVSRGLAKLLKGSGVTVNTVLPGPTWTGGVETFVAQLAAEAGVSEQQMKDSFVPENRPLSLIERFIEPREVADLVAYVASPLSSATTGAAMRADGGIVDSLV